MYVKILYTLLSTKLNISGNKNHMFLSVGGYPGYVILSKMNQTCTPKHNLQDLHHQNEACSTDTLPKTNVALKIGLPNSKVVFQPSIFRGYVSLRECKTNTLAMNRDGPFPILELDGLISNWELK